jgi:hypothetical protein
MNDYARQHDPFGIGRLDPDRMLEARSLPLERGLLSYDKLRRQGGELVGPCPRCGGVDRFAVHLVKRVWLCRGCAPKGGGVIDLAMDISGGSFLEAVEALTGEPPPRDRHERRIREPAVFHGLDCAPAPSRSEPASRVAGPCANALEMWNAARPAHATIVDHHLVGRGLPPLETHLSGRVLRYHPACPWREKGEGPLLYVPAMVALRRSIYTDEPVSIHRTRLTAEGQKLGRQNLGPALDTAIKLDADEDVTMGLVIGEGIETSLAARQWLGLRPVWALGDAGAISTFPVLPCIQGLTILAEADEAGRRAVEACGSRWHDADREVIVVRPRSGSDINDAISGGAA